METHINAFFSFEDLTVHEFESEAWRKAEPIEINCYWSGEAAPVERRATARIVWTNQALFVRFDCNQNESFVISEKPNLEIEADALWERDACEIFVAPDLNEPEKYFEFEIAPTGEWLDYAIHQLPDKRKTNKDYNAGMKTASRIEKNAFTLIFSVEFERAFGKKPVAGESWRANLFRLVGAGETRGYLAWQPTRTEKPNFHVPSVFGYIRFKKN